MKKKYRFYSFVATTLLCIPTLFPGTVGAAETEQELNDKTFDSLYELVYNNPDSTVEQLDEDLSTITLEIDNTTFEGFNSYIDLPETGEAIGEFKEQSTTIISLIMDDSVNSTEDGMMTTFGSGSVNDSKSHSYGAVIGTVNYITKSIKNVTHYGITNISGQFIAAPNCSFSNRKVTAGQVGQNQSKSVNKTVAYSPTVNTKKTYTLNWTADSNLVAQGASVVGMNISGTAKKGSSTANVLKSITVINY